MKVKFVFIYILVISAIVFQACSRKDDVVPTGGGEMSTLSIQFDNIVGAKKLQLNTGAYVNASGETFNISLLQYYISNIKLQDASGKTFVVPQDSSYFLVKEGDGASQFAKVRVPTGDYYTLSFVLGVDSLRNTMDISKRTGVLDPATGMDNGMYWSWNSGYIFFKLEGTSDAVPADPSGQHKFRYHIGGFGGYSAPTINNIKTVTIDLRNGGIPRVRAGRQANVHLMVDVLKVFDGNTRVSLAKNSTVMFSDFSTLVANNYVNMFFHDHTEN